MKLKKRYRILLIVLSCCVLLSAAFVVFFHGEWWYPVLSSLRTKPAFSPTVARFDELTETTVSELCAREDVVYSSALMLINSDYPLPEGFVPELIEYNGAKMHPLMKEPYISMRDDVQERTGVRMYVSSDFRTAEEQEAILGEKGDSVAAAVGASEHEAGMALDMYAPHFTGMRFLRSPAGRTVNEICGEYGFIIRYPYGKEDITGIDYEPWHLRYVGQPHAEQIMAHGLTLEEYIAALTPDVWYQYGDYYYARLSADQILVPDGWSQCEISPDNTGYYIVTLKMN